MKRAFLLGILLLSLVMVPLSSFAQDDIPPAPIPVTLTEDYAFGAILLDGWVIAGDRVNGLVLANDEDLLATVATEGAGSAPESGLAYIQVVTLAREEWASAVEGAVDMSEVELLTALIEMNGGEDLGTPEEIEFDNEPAGYLEVSSENGDFVFMLHEVAPDVLAFTTIGAAAGEYATMQDEILGVLIGVGYSLELSQTVTAEDDTALFNYPTDWSVETESGLNGVSNDPAAFESDGLAEDQYGIIIVNVGESFGAEPVDLDNAAVMVGNSLMDEGQELAATATLAVGEEMVAAGFIENADEENTVNEGGYFIVEREDGFYAVIFFSSPGEQHLISFTALMMLLQPATEVEVETE